MPGPAHPVVHFSATDDPVFLTPDRSPSGPGVAATILAGAAVAAVLVPPPFSLLGLPLAVVGGSFGALSLVGALLGRRTGWGWPAIGLASNLAAFALLRALAGLALATMD